MRKLLCLLISLFFTKYYKEELKYQKFRRCMDNAEICFLKWRLEGARIDRTLFWLRRQDRWLDLARKYKR